VKEHGICNPLAFRIGKLPTEANPVRPKSRLTVDRMRKVIRNAVFTKHSTQAAFLIDRNAAGLVADRVLGRAAKADSVSGSGFYVWLRIM
jgi:hypothetical protein